MLCQSYSTGRVATRGLLCCALLLINVRATMPRNLQRSPSPSTIMYMRAVVGCGHRRAPPLACMRASPVMASAWSRSLVYMLAVATMLPLSTALTPAALSTRTGTSTPARTSTRRAAPALATAIPPMLAPIAGIGVLTSVVVIHELGHFLVARAQGIRVTEFSIGFGPPLLRLPSRGPDLPEYVLRALPIGGFVSFPRATNRTALEEAGLLKKGEQFDAFVANTTDLLENRPAREQAAVMVAGVAANVMLAWACLFTAGTTLGVPIVENQPVVVSRVVPASVAEAAGFRAGDVLIRVSGRPVDTSVKQARVDGT
jgi:hypothetical protein